MSVYDGILIALGTLLVVWAAMVARSLYRLFGAKERSWPQIREELCVGLVTYAVSFIIACFLLKLVDHG